MPAIDYYTARDVRELDRLAIGHYGIPGFTLMQRAAQAAFASLRRHWPAATRVIACCGTGNNGGDGCVVAALARKAGLQAVVYLAGERSAVKGDAAKALALAEEVGVPVIENAAFPRAPERDAVVVDALLGIGLTGEVRPPYRVLIDAINASGLPVLAIDVPSGLCSDTGAVLGTCVAADVTVTFIGRKVGLVRGAGIACAGIVEFDDLGVPADVYTRVTPALRVER